MVARPLDELASHMRVSRAFIHLCLSAGCPADEGKLSPCQLLLWLFDRYEEVRAIAGLRPLAEVADLPPRVAAMLRMANSLITILEFARSRSTNWRQKRLLRRAMEDIILLADRAA